MHEVLVHNPDKGRNETIRVYFDEENTTWFDDHVSAEGLYSLTDINGGGLLIREADYKIPLLLSELSRAAVDCDPTKVKELIRYYE